MAQVKLEVLGENKAGPAFKSLDNQVTGLESKMRSLAGVITGILTTAILGLSITTVFNKGIESVDNFQQSVVQTAAMITSLQGGKDIATNYRLAKEYAQGLQLTLQQVDARTTLNLGNLTAITEEMTKQGIILNTNNKSQIDAFTNIANAVAVYSRNGANEMQLRQEIGALLRGEVDQNSQLASMVQRTVDGPLKQWVDKHKQAGDLIEELGKKLSGFGLASEDLSQTWSAVKSSLQTSIDLVLRAGFTSIVKEISDWLGKINDYLKSHREEIGEKIKSAWETVKTVLGGVAIAAKTVWDNFEPFVTVIVGGTIIKGITGIIGAFTSLYETLISVRGAMIAIGALSGTAAAGAAGAAGTAAAGGGVMAAIGGGLAGAAVGIGGGIALGYGLQPAVRWADKKLYQNFGINLTGQAMYDEAEQRNQEADKRLSEVLAKKAQRGGKAGYVPSVTLGDTQEQIAEKIKLQEKELSVFKEMMDQKTMIAKGQAQIELDILKGRYDQGLASTRDYYEKGKQTALAAAQAEADNAIAFLHKEEEVLDFIKAKKGEKSPEYQEELAKNQKAIADLQKAQLDYGKTYIESENKMTAALRQREEEYQKLQITTLEASGKYVDAEKAKQTADNKSIEMLRLRKEAEEGIAGAVEALAAVEKRRSYDLISSQNKENEERRNYARDIASMRDELDKLRGKDQELLDAEGKLRDGRDKMASLQDKITLAWAQGNAVAISALSQQIQMQDQLNKRMNDQKQYLEDIKVLNGTIVGFNNGQAIEANGGGAFNNGSSVSPYQSRSTINNVIPGSGYSTGIQFVDMNGAAIPARAKGGDVKPYATYQINEDGTEYLTMGSKGGYITPANKVPQGGGISIGDLNCIFPNVTNQSTARDLVREATPMILDVIKTRLRAA